MKKTLAILAALSLMFSLTGCVGGTRENPAFVNDTLKEYEVSAPTSHPDAENDPENAIDTPAVNADREEMQGINREAYYNGEAIATGISGNQITLSYPGGSQGGMSSVTITDPSHRYAIDRDYVITVYDTYVKVVQINPVNNFGKCDIVSSPADGR